jgi:pimeloyl-ACP methyl ester carboxylesterase
MQHLRGFLGHLICLLAPLGLLAQDDQLRCLDVMLNNYDYPYPVEYLTINSQEQALRMAYMYVKAEQPNGKTVLLFHGKNFNGAYWETTMQQLLKEGYTVVVPDQIGFGKSSKPHHFHYTFHALAKHTKQLLDELGVKKTAVLGHSMGGMLATRFTLMYPDVAERLILANPIGLEDWKLKVPYRPVEWWYQQELKKSYKGIKAYQLKNYYDGKWKPAYDEWVNILAGWTLNSDYERIAWNAALTYDMIFTQPVLYEFKNISCPTLLIIGTRDRTALGKPLVSKEVRRTMGLYEQLGKQTQQVIPDARLLEIPNVGHLPHIESFQAFITPLLAFLEA